MSELPYYTLPEPPAEMNATGVFVRLLDSFGFRYRWATEGLREEDMEFRACDSSMSLSELLTHIYGLVTSTDAFITGRAREGVDVVGLEELRRRTLVQTVDIREALLGLDDEYLEDRRWMVPWAREEYPLWFLINGPLSDAFTHVGQVASWRRINGNPIPGANVFYGTPPKG